MKRLIRNKIELLLSALTGVSVNNSYIEEKKKIRDGNFSFKVIQILLGK